MATYFQNAVGHVFRAVRETLWADSDPYAQLAAAEEMLVRYHDKATQVSGDDIDASRRELTAHDGGKGEVRRGQDSNLRVQSTSD